MVNQVRIVPADPDHLPLLLAFIKELAAYERLADKVIACEEMLGASLFGPNRTAEAVIAYWGEDPAGFAVYFHNFSTFLGRSGIYLEDLFVRPALRGKGIGKALMQHIAKLAVERDCGRVEWAVLDWNTSAIEFYESLGAEAMNDWTVYRLSGHSLNKAAQDAG